ncbi:MAG TPA: recombination protein O N-terminal domain-containing protein [Candidatus Paceibacterota bacterium]|nr:recombination protein O N-terminal domain-containing protein [Candidatus Paceibacterota bacterium]
MYQKYQTDAIVLAAHEYGEADKTFALYTRDFGLVRARATSVRSEKSKMRYALQPYARANVSLVRGKSGWRAAGATASTAATGKDPKGVSAFARISELVVKLVHGEDHDEYLFDALAEAHQALMREQVESVATIEIVAVARILYALGYLSAEALETALFTHTAYADTHLREAEVIQDALLLSINKALSQTHL